MIERTEYLNWLIKLKDKQIIKVVSGVKRCGKSTLFKLYKKYLCENGIDEVQIGISGLKVLGTAKLKLLMNMEELFI